MTDEQIVAAAKGTDTPKGSIHLIHTREDGTEVPTFVAKQFARAVIAAATSESATDRIDASMCDEINNATPLERLRFFCSLAMTNGTDWIDSEPIFDALEAQLAAPTDLLRRLLADHQRIEPHHADACDLCREAQAAIV